jgi:signal transduction histidine kinase
MLKRTFGYVLQSALSKAKMDRFGARQPALMSYGFFVVSIFHNVANQLMQLQCELYQSAPFLPSKNYQELSTQLGYISEVVRHSQEILKNEHPQDEFFLVAPLLQKTKQLCQLSLQREQIRCRLHCPADLYLFGDTIVLQQILLNLFFNSVSAFKSVDTSQRWIEVEAFVTKKHIELTFRDTGPGFPKHQTEQYKEAFVSYQHQGVGLGLAYVEEQMEKTFQGRCLIQSTQQGTCIRLIFPRKKLPRPEQISNISWEDPLSHVQ